MSCLYDANDISTLINNKHIILPINLPQANHILNKNLIDKHRIIESINLIDYFSISPEHKKYRYSGTKSSLFALFCYTVNYCVDKNRYFLQNSAKDIQKYFF